MDDAKCSEILQESLFLISYRTETRKAVDPKRWKNKQTLQWLKHKTGEHQGEKQWSGHRASVAALPNLENLEQNR